MLLDVGGPFLFIEMILYKSASIFIFWISPKNYFDYNIVKFLLAEEVSADKMSYDE